MCHRNREAHSLRRPPSAEERSSQHSLTKEVHSSLTTTMGSHSTNSSRCPTNTNRNRNQLTARTSRPHTGRYSNRRSCHSNPQCCNPSMIRCRQPSNLPWLMEGRHTRVGEHTTRPPTEEEEALSARVGDP